MSDTMSLMPMRATTVRFTDDLWELLEKEAALAGVSAAQLIRDAAIMRVATLMARRGEDDGEQALAAVVARAGAPRRAGTGALPGLGDPRRVAAVRRTGLMGTPPEEAFDRLTRLAQRILDVPSAFVALIDDETHYLKSCAGSPVGFQAGDEVPLRQSLCQHAVVEAEPLILRDAREDPRFRSHPGPRELGVVAYAGIPLMTRAGEAIGTLCAVDTRPRLWTRDQIATLTDLAASAVTEAELAARS
jgi:hypothetical protein